MRNLICLFLLCVGCSSSLPPAPVTKVVEVPVPCPEASTKCTDKILSLSEEDLKAGFNCPSNSRLVFPSTFIRSEKLLVMCQCK